MPARGRSRVEDRVAACSRETAWDRREVDVARRRGRMCLLRRLREEPALADLRQQSRTRAVPQPDVLAAVESGPVPAPLDVDLGRLPVPDPPCGAESPLVTTATSLSLRLGGEVEELGDDHGLAPAREILLDGLVDHIPARRPPDSWPKVLGAEPGLEGLAHGEWVVGFAGEVAHCLSIAAALIVRLLCPVNVIWT